MLQTDLSWGRWHKIIGTDYANVGAWSLSLLRVVGFYLIICG